MDSSEFVNSPSGRLVPTVYGQQAFVPNPLPPSVDFNAFTIELDRASRAMAELKGMSYKVSNPIHLINPLQKREAIASSSIEGTYTTPSELLLFDPSHSKSVTDPDTREVYNYTDALQQGLDLLTHFPISSRLIKEVHAILLRGVTRHRGSEIVPGEYKRDQNFIGSRTRRLEEARFVPPPPSMTPDLMSDLEKFINSREAQILPPIIVNAFVHYQFETIHPFPDGNGRVGRLLVPLILASQDVMPTPLLYISPFIEKNKDEYNDLMLSVSKHGSWEKWICFFADAIEKSSSETMTKIDEIAKLREDFLQRVYQARASALLTPLIDLMFNKIIFSIPEAQKHLGVTYTAAKNNIIRLVNLGIAKDLGTKARPKLYVCKQLLDIVFEIDS